MLGPSGFFIPEKADEASSDLNNIELIHISEDGFNVLYRVCRNGRFFVYKALKQELRGNLLYEELLNKDFNIGFSLNHTGICQYFAKIQHPELGNCIVMEWVDGCTLEEFISKGKITSALSRKILCEICDALDYMHHKQVIHRDLKPENILITHNGQNIKIIDFGLSDTEIYNTLKSPAGTKAYASPELIAGEPIDTRSDIWSLGVIINELSGKYRHVASQCLRRDKDKRYRSAAEVKAGIQKEKSRKAKNILACSAVIGAICIAAILGLAPKEVIEVNEPSPTEEAFKDTLANRPTPATQESAKASSTSPKEKPAAEPKGSQPTDKINADELDELFNNAAQSIL